MARDDEGEHGPGGDPDRAAILARRRRFVALALTGLASAGCKGPAAEPCLSIVAPEDPDGGDSGVEPSSLDGPFIEDPGAPLEGEGGSEDGNETGTGETGEDLGPQPQACLKFVAPQPPPQPCLTPRKPTPKPCLKKAPSPQPCLFMTN